jgi:hypothetical protein
MRKGTFKIKTNTSNSGWAMEEVNGFISNDFGIFKAEHPVKKTFMGYSVTHLRTGLRLASFDFLRQARDYVDRVEKAVFPVAWDSSSRGEDFRPNAPKAIEIRNLVVRNG